MRDILLARSQNCSNISSAIHVYYTLLVFFSFKLYGFSRILQRSLRTGENLN